ncbi:MAG: hypothetical protein QF441_02285 [Bacteriovoracaceae bacterium]|nr:hypothetical protein [Bacteriovoracaceae bacterium]
MSFFLLTISQIPASKCWPKVRAVSLRRGYDDLAEGEQGHAKSLLGRKTYGLN